MKPSTLVELLGFTCLVLAASVWQSVALEAVTGLAAGGLALLLIGYATEDNAAEVAIGRAVRAVGERRARRKALRVAAKAKKALKA